MTNKQIEEQEEQGEEKLEWRVIHWFCFIGGIGIGGLLWSWRHFIWKTIKTMVSNYLT